MSLVCFNGNFFPEVEPLFSTSNRAFKYGDGLFETARFTDGNLILADLHFERLFVGLRMLQMEHAWISKEKLTSQISKLCELNKCSNSARVRLQVFRNEEHGCSYSIEAHPIELHKKDLPAKGYRIAVYPEVRKATDAFANLKSSNYLPYVMADLYAQKNGCDEAIVLNIDGHICDGSKTNIFLIQGDEIITPHLDQGCVAGVMRRNVIESLGIRSILVKEQPILKADLLEADAVFLTNAIRGICWVEQFNSKLYSPDPVKRIRDLLFFQTK